MSDIKKCFISRWGDDGCIMEVDYSQLEIVCLAWLAEDDVLMADLKSGADLHRMRAAELYNKAESMVTKQERRTAKALSFELQYGAGAKSMAATHSITLATANRFIKNYYTRYKKVKAYQKRVAEEVGKTRMRNTHTTERKLPAASSMWPSCTGRTYLFREYDAPEWLRQQGVVTTFSPTEMKNRPVQGFATGDIMALARVAVFLALRSHLPNDCVLVQTIHDSIVLDIKKDMVYTIGAKIKEAMEDDVIIMAGNSFDIDVTDLPLAVTFEVGDNWLEMKGINI